MATRDGKHKAINKMAKMRRVQNKVKKHLEARGFKIWLIHHTRFQKDIWNLWDGIFISPEKQVGFIQIKSERLPSPKPYLQFTLTYPEIPCILAAWVSRKGIITRIIKGGKYS